MGRAWCESCAQLFEPAWPQATYLKLKTDCPGSLVDQNFFPLASTMPVQCTNTVCPFLGNTPLALATEIALVGGLCGWWELRACYRGDAAG